MSISSPLPPTRQRLSDEPLIGGCKGHEEGQACDGVTLLTLQALQSEVSRPATLYGLSFHSYNYRSEGICRVLLLVLRLLGQGLFLVCERPAVEVTSSKAEIVRKA